MLKQRHTITVERRERIPCEGGFTSRRAGDDSVEIELVIDVDAIARQLGHKASGSRSGRSGLAGGKITAKVISRTAKD